MKTGVISCSTGPDSWHTYRLELSQFVTGDEGEPRLPGAVTVRPIDSNGGTGGASVEFVASARESIVC